MERRGQAFDQITEEEEGLCERGREREREGGRGRKRERYPVFLMTRTQSSLIVKSREEDRVKEGDKVTEEGRGRQLEGGEEREREREREEEDMVWGRRETEREREREKKYWVDIFSLKNIKMMTPKRER